MNVHNIEEKITHCSANCIACGWEETNPAYARRAAYHHNRKTAHRVVFEKWTRVLYEGYTWNARK